MRIAFDAKRAAQNRTGLGNYSRFILDVLDKHMPNTEFLLFAPKTKDTALIAPYLAKPSRFSLVGPKGAWQWCRSLWRTFGMAKDIKNTHADIYHGLSNELPLNIRQTGCKSIVTIHDVIYRSFPQGYKPIDRWLYDFKYGRSCRNADHIIAVSEHTKREIMRYYHVDSTKISVVYQGCDAQFKHSATDQEKEDARRTYALPERYVLYLGTIEARKNLLLLAKALRRLPDDVKVLACGRRTPYCDEVEAYVKENHLENRIQFCHNAAFRHLPAIYQMADVFVYPSRVEGFGIPILEALCSGTPVVACTGSCLEEAGGPDSIYVAPDDDAALADAILRIKGNATLRQQMVERGRLWAKRFEDERLAKALIAVYKKVANQTYSERP